MGRHKIIEDQQVLVRAMEAFRRRGYNGASIKYLERATGLTSGSIYHSYGDKAGLFRAAFAYYNESVVRCRIENYAPPAAGLEGLRELFLSLLREPESDSRGCLVTNAAIEFGAGDSVAESGIEEGFRLLRAAFTRSIAYAEADGQLSQDVKPEHAVVRLLALYQGVLVLIRGGQDTSTLPAAIDNEFRQLSAPE
jgi:TetR/AcrR family transcriptional regulator, transcriptional repressor for nem operon